MFCNSEPRDPVPGKLDVNVTDKLEKFPNAAIGIYTIFRAFAVLVLVTTVVGVPTPVNVVVVAPPVTTLMTALLPVFVSVSVIARSARAGRDSPNRVTTRATTMVANRLPSGVIIIGLLTRATESFSPCEVAAAQGVLSDLEGLECDED